MCVCGLFKIKNLHNMSKYCVKNNNFSTSFSYDFNAHNANMQPRKQYKIYKQFGIVKLFFFVPHMIRKTGILPIVYAANEYFDAFFFSTIQLICIQYKLKQKRRSELRLDIFLSVMCKRRFNK